MATMAVEETDDEGEADLRMLPSAQVDFASARLGELRFRFAIPVTQNGYDPKSNASFVQYCIMVQVQGGGGEDSAGTHDRWMVKRRAEHFANLHALVQRALEAKGVNYRPFLRPLPRRRYFETNSAPILSKRRKRLKEFLQDVLALAEVDADVCALACTFFDIDEDAVGGVLARAAAASRDAGTAESDVSEDGASLRGDKRSRVDQVLDVVRRGWLRRQKRAQAGSESEDFESVLAEPSASSGPEPGGPHIASEPSSTSVTASLALRAGFLAKRSGLHNGSKTWKRRYFRLLPMGLSYYAASTMTLLGVVRVGESSGVVACMSEDQAKRTRVPAGKYGFVVTLEDRELVLCADTASDREGWMQALRMAIGALQTHDGGARDVDAILPQPPQSAWLDDTGPSPFLRPFSAATTSHHQAGLASRGELQHTAIAEQAEEDGDEEEEEEEEDKEEACVADMEQLREPQARVTTLDKREEHVQASEEAMVEPSRGRPERGRLQRRGSSASSISFDPFDDSRKRGKVRKEEESFDAPDLQRKDPWEVDWTQIEMREKVGEGANGQVFRGSLWGSEVAVKRMHCDDLTPTMLRALRKEVTILSQLRHPCVVLYIGACTQPPNVCMITEWCSRGSLFDVLHSSSLLLDTKRRLDLALQVAKGMSYLHGRPKQIIHRDLKSMNVLVTQGWQAKVADFGLTIVRRKSDAARGQAPESEEEEGAYFGIQGTPQWMAPEVMEGNRYNGKVDVYSFGIVLTEIFTRKMPFADRYKRFDFVDAVLEGETPTIPVWASDAASLDDFDESDEALEETPARDLSSDHNSDALRQQQLQQGDPELAPGPGLKRASAQTQRSSRFRRKSLLFGGDSGDDKEDEYPDVSSPLVPSDDEEGDAEDGVLDEDEESSVYEPDSGSPNQNRGSTRTLSSRTPHVMRRRRRRRQQAKREAQDALRELRRPANIQRLTLDCLSRDPRSRPSFQDIVARLSRLADNSSDELLEQFDLPRVHEMLEVGSLFDISLAARELTKIAHRVLSQSLFMGPGEDREAEDGDEFSSLSSMTNSAAKALLITWVCPLVVRLVDRLTRETDFILTRGGDRVQVHIPERILGELAEAIYNLLQVCSGDEGVSMQAANVLVDQGALPVLSRVFLFADAAQEFARVEVQPSAYDEEAEIQHIVKNRHPDFGSLLQAGLILSQLGMASQGTRVSDAIERAIADQLQAVDDASHLASRARSRCQSAGICYGLTGEVSFEPVRGMPAVFSSWPPPPARGDSRSEVDNVRVQDLVEENLRMKRELEALRRKVEALSAVSKPSAQNI